MAVVVILIFCVFVAVNAKGRLLYCYENPELNCTKHRLECDDGEIIDILNVAHLKFNITSCTSKPMLDQCADDERCCQSFNGAGRPVSEEIMDYVKQRCSLRQFCEFHPPYKNDTMYEVLFYSYRCISDLLERVNILCKDEIIGDRLYVTYNSKHIPVQQNSVIQTDFTCTCQISTTGSGNITVKSLVSDMDCTRFLIGDSDICNRTVIPPPFNITMTSTTNITDKLIGVRFLGSGSKTVKCYGCDKDVVIPGTCGGRKENKLDICYGPSSCPVHRLECEQGQLLAIKSVRLLTDSIECYKCADGCCYSRTRYTGSSLNIRVDNIMQLCNDQQSCNILTNIFSGGHLARYTYDCYNASDHYDFMGEHSIEKKDEIFLSYTSKPNVIQTTMNDCMCEIMADVRVEFTMTLYYLNLHADTCCHLSITPDVIFSSSQCSVDGITKAYRLSSQKIEVNETIIVSITNMASRLGDHFLFRFNSKDSDLKMKCTGCKELETGTNQDEICVYSTTPVPDDKPESTSSGGGVDQSETRKGKVEGGGDKTGGIIGGVVGVVIVIVIIICIIIFIVRMRKNKHTSTSQSVQNNGASLDQMPDEGNSENRNSMVHVQGIENPENNHYMTSMIIGDDTNCYTTLGTPQQSEATGGDDLYENRPLQPTNSGRGYTSQPMFVRQDSNAYENKAFHPPANTRHTKLELGRTDSSPYENKAFHSKPSLPDGERNNRKNMDLEEEDDNEEAYVNKLFFEDRLGVASSPPACALEKGRKISDSSYINTPPMRPPAASLSGTEMQDLYMDMESPKHTQPTEKDTAGSYVAMERPASGTDDFIHRRPSTDSADDLYEPLDVASKDIYS